MPTKPAKQQSGYAARMAVKAYIENMDVTWQSLEEIVTELATDLKDLVNDDVSPRLSSDGQRSLENGEPHNGWSNYETWLVYQWLSNSFRSYFYWRSQAKWYLHTTVESEFVLRNVWTKSEAMVYQLADELRESLTKEAAESEPSVFSDLLRAATCRVNWKEIAKAFIDEEQRVGRPA